jgi:hypothetical protein
MPVGKEELEVAESGIGGEIEGGEGRIGCCEEVFGD